MWRSLASNMLTFLIVALFLLGGVILWGRSEFTAEGPLDQAICLRVERGASMGSVSRDLASQGAIRNATIFRLGADYTDKSGKLKAGSFLVEPGASMQEIVDQVTRGGASTCGTEIVYRVGVTQTLARVRELDPATSEFAVRAEFDPTQEAAPEIYAAKRAEPDTRYRIALAEGVTSWQVVEALRAIDVLEGEIAEVPPEVWTGWRTDPDYAPPGGESHAAVYRRVTEACEELIRDARDRQVVVVTHVSPIKVAVAWALGLEATANQRTWLDVASITRIELRGDRAVLRSFNETLHLA